MEARKFRVMPAGAGVSPARPPAQREHGGVAEIFGDGVFRILGHHGHEIISSHQPGKGIDLDCHVILEDKAEFLQQRFQFGAFKRVEQQQQTSLLLFEIICQQENLLFE